ncbi:DNA methyltransferase [Roseinatronobacter sp.]|uniref:DNA methyltransferase n=1 Tax=Roseinatronobacter sp. TaxID=1945755 RepID=UPI0025D7231F|nr:DNA methyltransferase [Roseibaca sp.]
MSPSGLKPSSESFGAWATRLRRVCSARQKSVRRTSGCGSSFWPTPAAQNWKGSSPDSITRTDGKSRMDILHYRAEQGFTRPAPAITLHGAGSSPHAPISRRLWASMIASHGRSACRRVLKGRSRRRLNPLFVGWLMGWPIGHALCACSETEFIHWQQHMRGALSRLPMALGPWIWRPTDQAQRPAQMDFLERLKP